MNWLRTRREKIGLETQDDLAVQLQLEGVSVTRGAVSHWENGTRSIPLSEPDFRRALARVLKISEPELLKLAGYIVQNDHTDEGERGAWIIDNLTPEKRKLALKLLEQLQEV